MEIESKLISPRVERMHSALGTPGQTLTEKSSALALSKELEIDAMQWSGVVCRVSGKLVFAG